MSFKDVMNIFSLAVEYGLDSLKLSISEYLISILHLENCCAILNVAILHSLKEVQDVCLIFMERVSSKLLEHATFKTLSQDSLCALLRRDSFYAPEIDIFTAVHDWYGNNSNADSGEMNTSISLQIIVIRIFHVLSIGYNSTYSIGTH